LTGSLVSGNVLLTGATGGIGAAIARAMSARGATLTLSGRRADVLEPLARELGARAMACDLSDREATARLAREAGDVDVLVANAALPATGELGEFSQEQVDRVLEVNLRAPIALAHTLAPGMVARRRGHMVFISSLSGKSANPASSLYSATKFGLRGFALSLREDLRSDGVGVSVVLPGFIRDAGMFAEARVELPRGVGTRRPEDVAGAVIAAVEHDRAEVDVAPLSLRLGAAISSLAPELSATVARRLGSERVSRDLAEGQRHKR
jgi:short-subunit dehydrogenase